MSIGEKIKQARKKKKWTQAQLGEKIGVTQQMIGIYEKNQRKPKPETLKKIADALEVNISDLYDKNSDIVTLFAGGSAADKVFMKNVEKILNEALVKQGLEAQDIAKNISRNVTETMKALGKSTADNLNDILEPYSKLNEKGKQKAVEYTHDLTQIDEYTKE